jgi:hypothetical protein
MFALHVAQSSLHLGLQCGPNFGTRSLIKAVYIRTEMNDNSCMKFLVLTAKGNTAVQIMLRSEEDEVAGEFESWALGDGKQVEFVTLHLAKMFKQFYMYGTFQTVAVYGLTYEEMLSMMRHRLGPSDRDRCEELQKVLGVSQSKREKRGNNIDWFRVLEVTALLVIKILTQSVRFVFIQVITLMIILFIKKPK